MQYAHIFIKNLGRDGMHFRGKMYAACIRAVIEFKKMMYFSRKHYFR